MRPFLSFLTILLCFNSCKKDTKEVKEFDLDSQNFMIFNPGSYWLYEDNEGELLTITLQDVEEGTKDANVGDGLSEYRVETYWDSQKEQVFYRTSTDSVVELFSSEEKNRDVFKFKWRYGTYLSNLTFEDIFMDNDFLIVDEEISSGQYTKTISTSNAMAIDSDTGLPIAGPNEIIETTLFSEGIGMVEYNFEHKDTDLGIDTIYTLELISYYIQP